MYFIKLSPNYLINFTITNQKKIYYVKESLPLPLVLKLNYFKTFIYDKIPFSRNNSLNFLISPYFFFKPLPHYSWYKYNSYLIFKETFVNDFDNFLLTFIRHLYLNCYFQYSFMNLPLGIYKGCFT
jgi:hypothetical protein